uniref:Uncharacterized protein n=1 Tax=Mycena chlorophos TaxID=658473 RepID=A0ABQ0M6A4_MYCCL|nr:predicted protein [Mycena chlorophos]
MLVRKRPGSHTPPQAPAVCQLTYIAVGRIRLTATHQPVSGHEAASTKSRDSPGQDSASLRAAAACCSFVTSPLDNLAHTDRPLCLCNILVLIRACYVPKTAPLRATFCFAAGPWTSL